jgi:hypothetical protein
MWVKSCLSATNEFVKLLMAKIKRLEETRWKAGESGSKENQWVSPYGKGSFGVTGSQQTYNSMSALAKAIGASHQCTSKAWRAAMKKAPPFAQSVCFKCKHHELVFYKEVDSGKN